MELLGCRLNNKCCASICNPKSFPVNNIEGLHPVFIVSKTKVAFQSNMIIPANRKIIKFSKATYCQTSIKSRLAINIIYPA